MPSLLRHTACPVCGHRHHFSFLADELVSGREYEYVCPEAAKKATLRPTTTAEVVQFPPQGAVPLTPKFKDSFLDPGQPLPQARAEPAHPQAVDPGALPEDTLARVSPSMSAAPADFGLPRVERKVHEIGQEVHGLAHRVGDLEEQVATTPSGATRPQPAGFNEPETGPTRLQEVLPEVRDLARKVGGLEKLSDIVEMLKQPKE
jgi:hypothetical protein